MSIVIPVFNEEQNVEKLYKEIVATIKEKWSYEIVFVDDGSKDKSFLILKRIAAKNNYVKVIKLISNYGQSNAISAGINNSLGKIIVTMDSDLQHDPKDILPLAKKIKEGYHVACGWRKDRGASSPFLTKILPSYIANMLIRTLTGQKLHDSSGGMRAFDKRIFEVVHLYGEMHSYIPVLASWKGFKVTEVPITIRKRKYGKTGYTFTRYFRGLLDLLTIKFLIDFSDRPSHIFGPLGFISFIMGFAINFFFAYEKIFLNRHLYQDLPSIMLGVVLILLGIMFLGFGFIADMIAYDAISSQKRETYLIDKVI